MGIFFVLVSLKWVLISSSPTFHPLRSIIIDHQHHHDNVAQCHHNVAAFFRASSSHNAIHETLRRFSRSFHSFRGIYRQYLMLNAPNAEWSGKFFFFLLLLASSTPFQVLVQNSDDEKFSSWKMFFFFLLLEGVAK